MFFRYVLLIFIFILTNINLCFANAQAVKYIGEMNEKRALHCSQKLNDGTILIYGGFNRMEKYTNGMDGANYRTDYTKEESFEIFNPTDNSFRKTDLKFDFPPKEKISDLLSPTELNRIQKFFKNNEIKFQFIRYEKIDNDRILCIPFYPKYNLNYGMHPIAEYFTIYNLKTKKINTIVPFDLKTEMLNLKTFKTKSGIKIFFIYDFSTIAKVPIEQAIIYFKTAIFNPDKNAFEKVSSPIPIKIFYTHKLIQLENENIIIVEDNILKYIFNAQTEEITPLKNYGFRMKKDANIVPLNNHQLLITGGYTIKDEKQNKYKEKNFNGKKYFMLPEQIISKSAYIYSF